MLRIWLVTSALASLAFTAGCALAPSSVANDSELQDQALPESSGEAAATLTAPSGHPGAKVSPSLEPPLPELGAEEAKRQIGEIFPSHLQALSIQGRFPLLLHDLNGDGAPEAFCLGVLRRVKMGLLGDFSQLFQEDKQAVEFYLLMFLNERGYLSLQRIIYLGQWHVFQSLERMPLHRDRPSPLLLLVSFATHEGTDRVLLVFGDSTGVPVYRTVLKETMSAKPRLADIDGDGVIDLVVQERVMEEAVGYETFLTWYRWNGKSFREYQSRNVVRNLRSFLAKVKDSLLAGNVSTLIRFAFDPQEVRRLKRGGLEEAELLIRFLGLKGAVKDELPRLRDVVFPQIMENPFGAENERGSFFRLGFRLVDENGLSYLAETLLLMPRNPFREQQFLFLPLIDTGKPPS